MVSATAASYAARKLAKGGQRLTRELLVRLGVGQAGLKELVMSDDLEVEGSRLKLLAFLSLLDKPDGRFPIVTP